MCLSRCVFPKDSVRLRVLSSFGFFGCSLLAAAGCSLQLLASGCCWLLASGCAACCFWLLAAGCSLLAAAGCSLLAAACCFWLLAAGCSLLAAAGCSSKILGHAHLPAAMFFNSTRIRLSLAPFDVRFMVGCQSWSDPRAGRARFEWELRCSRWSSFVCAGAALELRWTRERARCFSLLDHIRNGMNTELFGCQLAK